jgi:PAS domain S-box-containing protein
VQNTVLEPNVEASSAGLYSRQRAAVLSFGRRANVAPSATVLVQDAVALLCEMVSADLGGTTEIVGDELLVRISWREEHGRLAQGEELRWPLGADRSLAGYALHNGTLAACSDLGEESRFHDDGLRRLGVRSALVIPMYVHKQPTGVLGVYGRTPLDFADHDLQFAEMIGQMLCSAVTRLSDEAEYKRNRDLSARLLDMVDALVIVLAADGTIKEVNDSCTQAAGYTAVELANREFCTVLAAPDDRALFRGALLGAVRDGVPRQFQGRLLTRDGATRTAQWSLHAVADATAAAHTLVLSGTEQMDDSEAGSSPRPRERRLNPRQVFHYRQPIAPLLGDALPPPENFTEVKFVDISSGGFCFQADERPQFARLVVALGKPPLVSYFAARVLRVTEATIEGRRQYLVGCQFLGRLHL